MDTLEQFKSSFSRMKQNTGQRRTCAMLLGMLGSVLSAFTNLTIQFMFLEIDNMHPQQITLIRKLGTFVMSVPFVLITDVTWRDFTTRDIITPIMVSSVTNYAATLLAVFALGAVTLSDYYTVSGLAVYFNQFLSRIVLGEPMLCFDGILALFTFAGIILVAQPDFLFGAVVHTTMDSTNSTASFIGGISLMVVGTFSDAVAFVYARLAYRKTNSSMFLFVDGILGVVATVIIMAATGVEFLWPKNLRIFMLMMNVAVGMFLVNLFCHMALENSVILSIIRNLDIVFAILLQYSFFGIQIALPAYFGSAVVILSVAALAVFRSRFLNKSIKENP